MLAMRILLAAFFIAAAAVGTATNASAQKSADTPEKAQTDKRDGTEKASNAPSEKADTLDFDGLLKGVKEMIEKEINKEEKPASTPAK